MIIVKMHRSTCRLRAPVNRLSSRTRIVRRRAFAQSDLSGGGALPGHAFALFSMARRLPTTQSGRGSGRSRVPVGMAWAVRLRSQGHITGGRRHGPVAATAHP